jgi:tight adherence protein C
METFAAVCAGILIYCVIVILMQKRGTQNDSVRRRLDVICNVSKKTMIVDEELGKPFMDRFVKPALKSLTEKLSKLVPKSKEESQDAQKPQNNASKNQANSLKTKLMQAGFTISAAEYSVIRLFVVLGCALLFTVIGIVVKLPWSSVLLALFTGMFFGYTVMRYFLSMKITKRRQIIEQQLPEVLDLLSVSVEAGLGFEQAISHVTKSMEGPLIDELTVTSREMAMGRSRKDALLFLGERCGVEDIKMFAGAVVQAGQLGISMKNVLQSQAAAMRQTRKARIQEKASKISVKILIPMIMFIFPVIFIVLLGPAIVSIMKTLK